MKKIMLLIIFSMLASCATGTWDHRSGNNTNLNFDKGYCRSFANSRSPLIFAEIHFIVSPMSGVMQ